MMKQTLIASAVACAFLAAAAPAMAEDAPAAPPPPYTLTANIGIVSDYVFRGISQSHTEPAIQGGLDFTHSSGLYVGTWLSSISWVGDGQGGSYPTEVDVYGGYRNTFATDYGYDIGVITYNYPGSGRDTANAAIAKPDTVEAYASLSWKWLSAKYSYVTSSHFVGWVTPTGGDTKGSEYLEANAAYDLGGGWGISAHAGHQKVKNFSLASYTDWNVGVTKDVGFGVLGLKYSETNTSGSCNSSTGGTSAYCWGTNYTALAALPTTNFKDVSDGVAIVSFTKTF